MPPFSLSSRGGTLLSTSHVAGSLGGKFEVVFVAFDLKRLVVRADNYARRFESIEQPAGFFPDIVDPLAEIGAGGAIALAFEPERERKE